MKILLNKKIYIPIVAALAACFIFTIVYLGLQSWGNYKIQKQQAIEIQKEQQRELELQKVQEDLEKELKEKSRDEELANLKQQLLDLQNKPPETKTVTNTVTVEAKDTIVDIVKKWSPRVAHIKCSWYYPNGALYGTASGSATLVNFTYLGIRAITSRHIFLSSGDKSLPKDCKITLINQSIYSVLIDSTNVSIGKDEDWAYVTLPKDDILTNITQQNVKLCGSVEIGDKLLVLGYPKIGSTSGLTVTEGIVSGFDETYYITSAKIDKGNSGGAAILVKDDCYLGIPSASVVGAIESLGRILKASFVIAN